MKVTMSDREGFAAFLLRCRARGLQNIELLKAIESVPRRAFVAPEHAAHAWKERSIPIECGEALEPLDLQAAMLHALDIKAGQRVLEIGTGSGFTTAVMARLAGKLTSIERYRTLVQQAQQRLSQLGLSDVVIRHDNAARIEGGHEGPFDRIIVWAAFEALPRAYVDLLSSQGQMIAPVGEAEAPQDVLRLVKVGSRFERETIGTGRFQPLSSYMPAVL